MDFSFNINDLLREEITQVDSRLQPCRQNGVDRHGFRQLQTMLYEVVDKMGDASAKAQSLHGPITTGKKLELAGHRLYIMKDANCNRGNGSAIGILKIGTKKLFVYDHSKVQHELDPLCVLDFYVHESRQRMGCGRKLFDFMLRCEGVPVQHLAVDRPSPKFLSFLRKHYNLRATIPQVNNFVIFEGFFNSRTDAGNNRNKRGLGSNHFKPPINHARPASGHKNAPTAYYDPNPAQSFRNNNWIDRRHQSPEQMSAQQIVPNNPLASGNGRQSHMGAGEMMYSRHGVTPPGSYQNNTPTPTRGTRPQEDLSNTFYKQLNAHTSPSMCYNTGTNLGSYGSYIESLPPKHPQQQQGHDTYNEVSVKPVRGPSSTPNFGTRSGAVANTPPQSSRNSNSRATPPPPLRDPRYPSQMSQVPPPGGLLPEISPNQQVVQGATRPSSGSIARRPPSGKKSSLNQRTDSTNAPLLPRDGVPKTYQDMLNMHQMYQGRNGHLAIQPGTTPVSVTDLKPSQPKPQDPRYNPQMTTHYKNQPSSNTSWTVMGVLREQRLNAPMSSRYHNSNRLW